VADIIPKNHFNAVQQASFQPLTLVNNDVEIITGTAQPFENAMKICLWFMSG
jgi:hypothetical protein